MDYSKIAEQCGVAKSKAEEIVKLAIDAICGEVADEGKCWVGRNYFKKVDRQARQYRNPRTGELGTTEPVSYVVFRRQI